MKTTFPFHVSGLLLAALLSLPIHLHAQEEAKPAPLPLSAAVLNFEDSSEDLNGVGTSLATLLQVNLSIQPNLVMVERAQLNEILGEQELVLSGAVSADQAAKIGQLTGAEVLISGRVFAVQDRIHVVAKVISVSTSRVFGATSSYDRGGKVDGAIEKLGQDVGKILTEKAADLRGGPTLENRILSQTKKMLEGKPARKVYVHIPEQIIQAPAPDPAARTEIARTLEAAGWTIVDAEKDAEVIIRGEAFAESAARRGNLWFTRARLEYSVLNSSGKILKTDRVVVGNVDLAQAVSAKGALQKAGLVAVPSILTAWLAEAK